MATRMAKPSKAGTPPSKSGENVPKPLPTETPGGKLREKVEEAIGLAVAGEQRVQVIERVTQLLTEFRGPLPPPEYLKGYEEACPGSANRIIRMAEIAQDKRECRNDMIVKREYDDRRLGMCLGFAALGMLLLAGTAVTIAGFVALGTALFTTAVIGTAVGTFVHGRGANGTQKQS